jgi:hypothetical protein
LFSASPALAADIPATPLMTVYRFDGPLALPYHEADDFVRRGKASAAGSLTQGSAVIPCLVLRDGQPVTDESGTPYVGFEVVFDADTATPAAKARFDEVASQRRSLRVANHHCPPGRTQVIDVRSLQALGKPPQFDPPRGVQNEPAPAGRTPLDRIVRAFHASRLCEAVNARLVGRRERLQQAWSDFAAEHGEWPAERLTQARHLDFVLRTAIFEGHLGRGCTAYGACERNVIALSIRNRALERCLRGQGCSAEGDFEGVASAVSQYNIWDEVLTQTTGLTSCFLRPDLAGHEHYGRLQRIYEQSAGDVENILFGGGAALATAFPGSSTADLTRLRHYYHPPAMGKCFPQRPRLEYISGAVARRGGDFALVSGTRVEVDEARDGGYLFQIADVVEEDDGDVIRLADRYPGFVIDGRKLTFVPASRCSPYGTPSGCRFARIGRHRKTPSWLDAGDPLTLSCRVRARGNDCRGEAALETARVGGACDVAMQPVAGVP